MKKYLFTFFAFFCCAVFLSAEDMLIRSDDIRLVQDRSGGFDEAGGFHLYIRKKTGIESVMLTETTKDPEGKADSYAYRASSYNPVNGDEIRYLNGKILDSKYGKYSLIDSTAEKDEVFGEAFHIYIPSEIEYGYSWSRNGVIKIDRGTFINIRSFSKKYGDYTGSYADNPFMFDFGKIQVKVKPVPVKDVTPLPPPVEEPPVIVLTDSYNSVAAEKFKEIADFNKGKMIFSDGPESLPDDIMKLMDDIPSKEVVDIVFTIDTTGSMKDDLKKLKEEWIPKLIEKAGDYKSLRLGLLLYRDYGDNYKLMNLPVYRYDFTDNVEVFKKNLNKVKIIGKEGGDIPEAVYEALFASMDFYVWRENAVKKIILIGDAEPHPHPRGLGKYSKELVKDMAQKKNIVIDSIIVPDNKSDRGR